MRAVYRKELRALLTGWNAWLAVALVAGFFGATGFFYHYMAGYAAFELTAVGASLSLLIAAPLLAMGLFSDERRDHTDRLLASLPVRMHSVALGKVMAALTMALICAVGALPGILVLAIGSNIYAPMAFFAWCLFALALLAATSGCALVSMGAPNRPIGFLCGAALMALCYFSGDIAGYVAAMAFSPLLLLIIAAAVVLIVYGITRDIRAALVCALISEAAAFVCRLLGQAGAVTRALAALFEAFDLYAGIDRLTNTAVLSLDSVWHLIAFAALGALFAALAARGRIFRQGRAKA